jgi:uncharacterized integral membrane protein
MPWRFIGLILILGIFLAFIGFNLDNRCDISFGFAAFTAVPVYLTAFSAFILGLVCALPFAFLFRKKKGKTSAQVPPELAAPEKSRKKWGKKAAPGALEGIPEGDDGSYGID